MIVTHFSYFALISYLETLSAFLQLFEMFLLFFLKMEKKILKMATYKSVLFIIANYSVLKSIQIITLVVA